jgi:hypothetical protein
MEKKHFTEEQIAFAFRQAESGISVAEVTWKLERMFADLSLDKKIHVRRPGRPMRPRVWASCRISWSADSGFGC